MKVNRTTSCRIHFQNLNILAFPSLIIYECCTFVKQQECLFTANITEHAYNTRNRGQLQTFSHRTALYEKGPNHFCIKAYNSIPSEIRSIDSFNVFKKKVRVYLLQNNFYNLDHIFNFT